MTNPEMLEEYVKNTLALLRENPDLDARQLADEFLDGYYGREAAVHLRKVLALCEASVTRSAAPPMTCYHTAATDFLTPGAAEAALAEMDRALAAANRAGGPFPRRVRAAKMSWDHAKILHWTDWRVTGDRSDVLRRWMDDLGAFGVRAFRETTTRRTLDDYLEKLKGTSR